MDLCDKYLVDQVNIYPPMNDYLQYTKFLKRKGILPNHLSKQFNKHSINRIYQLMIWGKLRPQSGKIETLITRSSSSNSSTIVTG